MPVRVTTWVDVDTFPTCSRHDFDLALDRLADGSWLTVPVKVVVGTRRRPRLVAIAGVHGDEAEGMLALLEFWEDCRPEQLAGTVVAIPVANPPAFAANQRRSPLDGLDLNRIFPGRRDGSPSERLAYHLMNDVVTGADFVFSLHSWYSTGMVVPYVEVPVGDSRVGAQSLAAATAAGFKRLRQADWPAGLLVRAANEMGIPGIEAEIGGQGMSTPENRAAYVDHLTRLLQYLGIRSGPPPRNDSVTMYARGQLYAPVGGMLRLAVAPGQYVGADTLLAWITDLHGQRIAEIRAPHAGLVAAVRHFVSVNPGDHVFAFYPQVGPGSS